MSYFLLSKSYLYTYKHLQILEANEPISPYISNSLHHYLCNIKEKINIHEKEWDIYKKYTNPYEYIHTNIPYRKKCISKHKPLSRAYFKMIELLYLFNILKKPTIIHGVNKYIDSNIHNNHIYNGSLNTDPIHTFHLAEGPGGFIEAIVKLRANPNDIYIGMTIINNDMNDSNIPGWKKSNTFLKENTNVYIEPGIDNTGDILNINNFIYCKEKYKSSMDFITADGGFDFSIDFNSQEINISRLLFAQIAYAVCMQKKNGTFILKIFDIFMLHTIDLIYLLSSFYKKVYVIKPNTSRLANSEKYVVCQHFLFDSCDEFYPYFLNTFHFMSLSNTFIYRFLNLNIPTIFLNKIEEINSIFGQQQIENIYNTISIIETKNKNKNDKIEILIKNNIQKCIHWCINHNIPYYIFSQNNNISTSNGFMQPNMNGYIQNSFSNTLCMGGNDLCVNEIEDSDGIGINRGNGKHFMTKPSSKYSNNNYIYNSYLTSSSATNSSANVREFVKIKIDDMEIDNHMNSYQMQNNEFISKKMDDHYKNPFLWSNESIGNLSNIFLDNTKNIDIDIDNSFLQYNINTIHSNLFLSHEDDIPIDSSTSLSLSMSLSMSPGFIEKEEQLGMDI